MKRTVSHVVKLALVIVLGAGASARLLQAQLPQGVGTWLSKGAVADPRVGAAAVTLDDGRTVVVGGTLADGSVTDSVTVYDPVSNATMAAGQLFAPRVNASAALLADGRVLVTGGLVGGAPSADVEVFDLATGTGAFATTMADPRLACLGTTVRRRGIDCRRRNDPRRPFVVSGDLRPRDRQHLPCGIDDDASHGRVDNGSDRSPGADCRR